MEYMKKLKMMPYLLKEEKRKKIVSIPGLIEALMILQNILTKNKGNSISILLLFSFQHNLLNNHFAHLFVQVFHQFCFGVGEFLFKW